MKDYYMLGGIPHTHFGLKLSHPITSTKRYNLRKTDKTYIVQRLLNLPSIEVLDGFNV